MDDTAQAWRTAYAGRMNRALDLIQAHLGEPLALEAIARAACFSPFHFHRLFRAWTGETVASYVQRLRLERAAWWLVQNPRSSVTEIALDAGFGSSSAFARAFREAFGMTASAFRKTGQALRKDGKVTEGVRDACWGLNPQEAAMRPPFPSIPMQVRVEELPPTPIAYIRHLGPYKGDSALFEELYGRLCAWAGSRGLIGKDTTFLSVYRDSPEITEPERLRLDVALTVPERTPAEGEVGRATLEGGRYALARISIRPDQYEAAWATFMGEWLPASGFQAADGPCVEFYRNDPKQDPEGLHVLDMALPVKPL